MRVVVGGGAEEGVEEERCADATQPISSKTSAPMANAHSPSRGRRHASGRCGAG
ncbi:MAG: hypothetical protein ABI068_07635 [Ktedonobacterales bacterium]